MLYADSGLCGLYKSFHKTRRSNMLTTIGHFGSGLDPYMYGLQLRP